MWPDGAARWRWVGAAIVRDQPDERFADWHRLNSSACHAPTGAARHTAAGSAAASAAGSAQDDGNHKEADDSLDTAGCPSGRVLFTGWSVRAYQRGDADAM